MKTFLAIFCLVIILTSPVAAQDFRRETIFPDPLDGIHPLPTLSYDPLIETIIDQTNLDSLIAYVRILSGEDSVWIDGSKVRIQHRISDWGNDLAAEYIKKQLETYNLEVYDQIYSADGRNIYAIQPGYLYPEEQYIICAHYDAVDDYCADDNASGVAAVLEAARILSHHDLKYTLVYALWDEEETGHWGSRYYVSQAHSDQADIQGVLNIDMIGWDGNDDRLADIHTRNIANSNSLANTLFVVNSLYDIALNPVIYNPGTWQSDHSSFWNYDYGAILLIEAFYGEDFNPYYHSSDDRIDKFDLSYFQNLTRLAIGAISTLIEVTDDTLITSINPDRAYQTYTLDMTINGVKTHFSEDLGTLDVWLSRDSETISADSFIVNSNTSLNANFSIQLTASLGMWDVNVETSIDGILTKGEGLEILPPPALPTQIALHQNYPNPFNTSTKIKFVLPKPENVKIAVYNTLGQKVKTLLNQSMKAGNHEVEFNSQNLSSGVYFYRIEAGEFQDVKKMILIK